MRPRSMVPVLTALACLSLAGCGGDDADPEPTASRSGQGDASDGGASAEPDQTGPAEPVEAGDLPDGCELVPRDLVEQTLGLDPGEGTRDPSAVGGPDNCTYAGIFGSVQVSPQPEVYFAGDIYEPGAVEGAVAAPEPADRGYAALGSFLVVKGSVGVFMTAIDPQDSTAEQWTELAAAVAENLP